MTRGEREEADSSRQFDGLILSDGGYQKKLATMLADSSSGNSDSSFFHPSDISFACPPNESHHNSSTHNRFSTGSTDSEGCLSSFMSPLSNIGSYNTLSMVDSNYHQFRSPSSSNLKKGNLPTMLPPLSSTVKRNSIVSLDADLEDDEEDDDLTAKLLATPSTSRPLDFSLVPETFQVFSSNLFSFF